MEQGYITVGSELFNLGVGALSLIVMLALIRLMGEANKQNAERNNKNDDTEKIQAQTNLKIVETTAQVAMMFEKLDASMAFNASVTQKQTATLEDIKADGRRQIDALTDIKNTFSAQNVAATLQTAQQPATNQIIQEHSEILKVTRDSQQILIGQSQTLGSVASRVNDLPTKDEVQAIFREDLKVIAALLNKISNMEATLTEIKTPLLIMQDKVQRMSVVVDRTTEVTP